MTESSGGQVRGSAQVELRPDQLARMNRLATMARLIAGLTHELNNSLQVIGGLSELLASHEELPPEVLARIRRIGGQAGKAAASIRQVQAFTREVVPDTGEVDLFGLVEDALSLRSFPLERGGIEVSVSGIGGEARVTGDRRQLTQLLLNLLLNAEDSLEGHQAPRLRIALTREGQCVRLTVSDNGAGLEREVRDRVGEPFVTTRSSERNLGLGLTVAEAIVAAHSGRLSFGSESGGTTVIVDLPAAAP